MAIVVLPCALSNHYHAVVFDRFGRYPEFLEHFHKLFARCQNALRGRWENLWASEQVCVVRLVSRDDVIDKLVYTAVNPVKDGLVDRVDHWPGVNGLRALLTGRSLRAERPRHFFRPQGTMPNVVEMPLTIPPELGPVAEVLDELRRRVDAAVTAIAAERQRTASASMDDASCCGSRGGIVPRAWSRGETFDRAWPRAARGLASRPCYATGRSSSPRGRCPAAPTKLLTVSTSL